MMVLGLATLLLFGWGCARRAAKTPESSVPFDGKQDVVLDGDCSQAKYQYACFLDNAVAKSNPDLCALAGAEKRLACVEAYEEITGVPVECNVLADPGFRNECMMVLGSVTSRKGNLKPANASGTGGLLDTQGLKVEQRQ